MQQQMNHHGINCIQLKKKHLTYIYKSTRKTKWKVRKQLKNKSNIQRHTHGSYKVYTYICICVCANNKNFNWKICMCVCDIFLHESYVMPLRTAKKPLSRHLSLFSHCHIALCQQFCGAPARLPPPKSSVIVGRSRYSVSRFCTSGRRRGQWGSYLRRAYLQSSSVISTAHIHFILFLINSVCYLTKVGGIFFMVEIEKYILYKIYILYK